MSQSQVASMRGPIWFFDGNIVIDASSTLFRVHRGVLAKNSDVFRDLFLVPQPICSTESEIDGCPVVQMHDSAEDWTHILNAMYDGRRDTARDLPKFSMIAAYLRLGKKYDIPQLRKEALQVLRSEYPSTLEVFDKKTNPIDYDVFWHHLQVIDLAHETGTRDILPAAFFMFCQRHSPAELVEKLYAAASHSILSSQEHLTFLSGCNRLASYLAEETYSWASDSFVGGSQCTGRNCRTKAKCAFFHNTIEKNRLYDALIPWRDIVWFSPEDENPDPMCQVCMETARKIHAEGRKRVWQKLPSAFGLSDWADLLKASNH